MWLIREYGYVSVYYRSRIYKMIDQRYFIRSFDIVFLYLNLSEFRNFPRLTRSTDLINLSTLSHIVSMARFILDNLRIKSVVIISQFQVGYLSSLCRPDSLRSSAHLRTNLGIALISGYGLLMSIHRQVVSP